MADVAYVAVFFVSFIQVVFGATRCYTRYGGYQYCTTGCCYDHGDNGCCNNYSQGIYIGSSVASAIGAIVFIIVLVCCCVRRRRRLIQQSAYRNQVVTATVVAPSNQMYGYPGQAPVYPAQPPSYSPNTPYPQGPVPNHGYIQTPPYTTSNQGPVNAQGYPQGQLNEGFTHDSPVNKGYNQISEQTSASIRTSGMEPGTHHKWQEPPPPYQQ